MVDEREALNLWGILKVWSYSHDQACPHNYHAWSHNRYGCEGCPNVGNHMPTMSMGRILKVLIIIMPTSCIKHGNVIAIFIYAICGHHIAYARPKVLKLN